MGLGVVVVGGDFEDFDDIEDSDDCCADDACGEAVDNCADGICRSAKVCSPVVARGCFAGGKPFGWLWGSAEERSRRWASGRTRRCARALASRVVLMRWSGVGKTGTTVRTVGTVEAAEEPPKLKFVLLLLIFKNIY